MACEKCWGDAYLRHIHDPSKGQADHYEDLLAERKDNPCSIAEQEGQFSESRLVERAETAESRLRDMEEGLRHMVSLKTLSPTCDKCMAVERLLNK